MRCKKHLNDQSSTIGVCASCLRDRLFSLIQAQSNQNRSIPDSNPEPNQNPIPNQNNPPTLIFPRSVSPYITRRKSEPVHQLFYSTPQINPKSNSSNSKKNKFGLISKLFRSRSGKPDPGPTSSTTSSSSSFVYFNNHHRGLSPERRWDSNEEKEKDQQLFEPSPARGFHRRPSPGRVRPSPSRSGIAFCLSPLVRPSPARHWTETGYSGEIRVPAAGGDRCSSATKPHLSTAASFCANRSRKMADFGRLSRNG